MMLGSVMWWEPSSGSVVERGVRTGCGPRGHRWEQVRAGECVVRGAGVAALTPAGKAWHTFTDQDQVFRMDLWVEKVTSLQKTWDWRVIWKVTTQTPESVRFLQVVSGVVKGSNSLRGRKKTNTYGAHFGSQEGSLLCFNQGKGQISLVHNPGGDFPMCIDFQDSTLTHVLSSKRELWCMFWRIREQFNLFCRYVLTCQCKMSSVPQPGGISDIFFGFHEGTSAYFGLQDGN